MNSNLLRHRNNISTATTTIATASSTSSSTSTSIASLPAIAIGGSANNHQNGYSTPTNHPPQQLKYFYYNDSRYDNINTAATKSDDKNQSSTILNDNDNDNNTPYWYHDHNNHYNRYKQLLQIMMIEQQKSNEHIDDDQQNVLIPKLAYTEINLGRVVGQGGFSVVTAVNSFDLDDDLYQHHNDHDSEEENRQQRQARKEFLQQISHNSRYVLKTLRTDLPEDEYEKGITDLAIESHFLSILSHPNIISMRAVANINPNRSRYFVILDRLQQTLDDKFNEWRGKVELATGYYIPCYGYCCSNPIILHAIWKERFDTIYNISNAIEYLHKKCIIYRDLKPDNIGYDNHGTLKLFDFGLAKFIDSKVSKCTAIGCEELYMLTGNTGSLRYMAPEVALDRPYDYSVDAYSFGILFWQICSLQTPFAHFSQKMHADRVVKNGERPRIDSSWPSSWSTIQQSCWHSDIKQRPSFTTIKQQLSEIMEDIIYDDGIVPNKTTEIRAKQRRMKVTREGTRLDIDTRIHTDVDHSTLKKFEVDIV